MFKITIHGLEYKVRFGMNSFVDTDLMDRTRRLLNLFSDVDVTDDDATVNRAKDLFIVTRDLFFYGFMKYNPINSPQEVGDMLDDYIDEAPEGEERSVMELFNMISDELLNQGFLAGLRTEEETPKATKRKK